MGAIVTNKAELEKALKAEQFPIKVTGDYAVQLSKEYHKSKKVKKAVIAGGAATAIASAIAIPFTGGTSAAGVVAGLTLTGLTIGTVTITAGELAILCGFTLGITAISGGLLSSRRLKVKFGKTEIEITEKV